MTNTKGLIKEAKAINLSLHFLEQVIVSLRDQTLQMKQQQASNALANAAAAAAAASGSNGTAPSATTTAAAASAAALAKGPRTFIPYRNSVLTNMLRDSLGGNCRSSFILTVSPEVFHFEESVATCRFGQRCGEVKVVITANTEVGLSDQLKELTIKVRGLEKQLAAAEEVKHRLSIELNGERQLRLRQTQPRNLSAAEQSACKTCVQDLLAVAKESILIASSTAGTAREAEGKAESELLIEQSHDKLFETVEAMDKSVLVELSTALGGLVQSMFIDRETTKQRLIAEEKLRRQAAEEAQARTNQDKRDAELILAGNFNQLESSPVLPAILQAMVLKGAIFIKYSRLGRKDVRSVQVSQDLLHLTWRPLVNAKAERDQQQGSHPLQFFER
jgi:hypothetical protein